MSHDLYFLTPENPTHFKVWTMHYNEMKLLVVTGTYSTRALIFEKHMNDKCVNALNSYT